MQSEAVVSEEIAKNDIDRWLDAIRYRKSKREANRESIDSLVENVMDGLLKVDDDGSMIQVFNFGLGEDESIKEIKYQNRLKVGEIHNALKNEKSTSGDARIMGYIRALTGQSKQVLSKMDTCDYSVSSGVALFFF